MQTSVRRTVTALVAVALAAAAAVVMPGGAAPAGAQTPPPAFYTPPSPLPAGQPGNVIKSERITFWGATATRVMYLSRDVNDAPMAVTGTVLVPTTPWTAPASARSWPTPRSPPGWATSARCHASWPASPAT